MWQHGCMKIEYLLLLLVKFCAAVHSQDTFHNRAITGVHNICSFDSAHVQTIGKHYNLTSPNYPHSYPAQNPYPHLCKVRLTACSGCQLRLVFSEVVLPLCAKPAPRDTRCLPGCDHLFIYELDYSVTTLKHYFNKSTPEPYSSISNTVEIGFCNSHNYAHQEKRFRIEYISLYKIKKYTGSETVNSVGTFSSPNFPWGYSRRNEVYKYLITSQNEGGFIRLTFDDWVVSSYSQIIIYYGDSERSKYFAKSGSDSRPAVLSNGPSLFVVFQTGQDLYTRQYIGFTARYQFVNDTSWPHKPSTAGCGGYLHDMHGGSFHFYGKTCSPAVGKDCLWVVTRYKHDSYTNVSLRIQDFYSYSGYSVLEIRGGNSSTSPLLGIFTSRNLTSYEFVNYIGFYIRLRAQCSHEKRLNIVFASFALNSSSEKGCSSLEHFSCGNNRCIFYKLRCDGVNHCGDWSDEMYCTSTTKAVAGDCKLYYLCSGDSAERYCASQRCDGKTDCADASDENNCPTSTESSNKDQWYDSKLYPYWGMYIPVGIVCCLLVIITCVTISCYTQRLRRRSRRRARSAVSSISRHITSNGSDDTHVSINVEIQHGNAHANRRLLDAPPTYDESMRYDCSAGVINWGFSGSVQAPPAYNSTDFNNSISVEPIQQPITRAVQALAIAAANSSTVGHFVNGHNQPDSTRSSVQIQEMTTSALGPSGPGAGQGDRADPLSTSSQKGGNREHHMTNAAHNTQHLTSTAENSTSPQPQDGEDYSRVQNRCINYPGINMDACQECHSISCVHCNGEHDHTNMAATNAVSDLDFEGKPIDFFPSVVETDQGLDNLGFLPDELAGGYASDDSSSLGSEPHVIDDSSSDSASVFMNSTSFCNRSQFSHDSSDSSDEGHDESRETYNLTPIDIQELQEEMTAVGSQARRLQDHREASFV